MPSTHLLLWHKFGRLRSDPGRWMVAGPDGEVPVAPLPDRFIRSAELVTAVIDGEVVALSVRHGSYFGMNAVGTRLWELLEVPRDVDELVGLIEAEFAVDPATARADIVNFLSQLHENGLLDPAT